MCRNDGWHWVSLSGRGDKKSNNEWWGGTRAWGGAETEKRELDQIRQMIRAISQSGSFFRRWKVLFPLSAVWSEGSVRGR